MIERGMGEYANPASIIKAAARRLRQICRVDAAEKLENALLTCPVQITGNRDGATCKEYADALMEWI